MKPVSPLADNVKPINTAAGGDSTQASPHASGQDALDDAIEFVLPGVGTPTKSENQKLLQDLAFKYSGTAYEPLAFALLQELVSVQKQCITFSGDAMAELGVAIGAMAAMKPSNHLEIRGHARGANGYGASR